MNIRTSLIIMLLISSLLACNRENGAEFVDGLHYKDGKPVRVEIADGKISRITALPLKTDVPEVYLAPGLIDIQINGYVGVSFSDQELTPAMMEEVTRALWKEGVTTFLPTVITRDQERLAQSFSLLAGTMNMESIGLSIPGFHLEGPYLNPAPGFRGAHPEQYIRPADWEEFSELQESAQQGIRLITVAPEMEGAIPFISKCREAGVVVSLAHHNAGPEIIDQAVQAGATFSTHLGNGCANMINRHHNPLWPQLSHDGLSISIICDGAHLTREEVRTFYKVKGNEGTILVSDALHFAGLPLGEYEEDGYTYLLTEEVVKFPDENVLAGAVQPVRKGITRIMEYTGCSHGEAVGMASTTPARLLGLDHLGEIKEGLRADLILYTLEENEIIIQQTLLAGEVVYAKDL
jgi:N-acetylglucosamine-6-phosphate deacetylase